MLFFLEAALSVWSAGLVAGALAFVALVTPAVMVRVFRRDIHPADNEVVLLGLRLTAITIVVAWPTLSWLWWP